MPPIKSLLAIRILSGIGLLFSWIAVILQYILLLQNNPDLSFAEATIRFITFFTILSNILVAISFSVFFFRYPSSRSEFFLRPNTIAALTLYILIVGAVYNMILRNAWHPQGLQKIVDEALHSFIPAYYFICWLLCFQKAFLPWKAILPWMVYPLTYLAVVMARGAITDYYPYPFLMVTKIGYPKVLLYCTFISFAFLLVGFAVIALSRALKKSQAGSFR
ncbi:MAG: Pr6Pr family membrane protein [Chitinophagales bacterium]